jgi:hypothetical protein
MRRRAIGLIEQALLSLGMAFVVAMVGRRLRKALK